MSGAVHPECPNCICGRRAPVQADPQSGTGPGSISWAEFLEAYCGYASRYGTSQSAERLAERAGFSYGELREYLGHDPKSWSPGR